jgi:hypothetical protein
MRGLTRVTRHPSSKLRRRRRMVLLKGLTWHFRDKSDNNVCNVCNMISPVWVKNPAMANFTHQGDQMSLWKITQNVAQQFFLQNLCITLMYRGKSSPKMWAISVIFIKLPKVNNDPLGEKFAKSGHPDTHTHARGKKSASLSSSSQAWNVWGVQNFILSQIWSFETFRTLF